MVVAGKVSMEGKDLNGTHALHFKHGYTTIHLSMSEAERTDPTIIGLDPEAAFQISNTHGEHAQRNLGNWTEFTDLLDSSGQASGSLEGKDATYYMGDGPGRFFSAYAGPGEQMVAGVAFSHGEADFSLDAIYCDEEADVSASALYQIMVRQLFSAAMDTKSRSVTFSNKFISQHPALERMLQEFSVTATEGQDTTRLLLPDRFLNLDELSAEEIAQQRQHPPTPDFCGVIQYLTAENPDGRFQDIFRNGKFVGSLAVLPRSKAFGDLEFVLHDAQDSTVEIPDDYKYSIVDWATQSVLALNALAAAHPEIVLPHN